MDDPNTDDRGGCLGFYRYPWVWVGIVLFLGAAWYGIGRGAVALYRWLAS